MTDNPYDRPMIVTILGILYALFAVALLIVAVAVMLGGDAVITEIIKDNPDMDWLEGTEMVIGATVLIGAVVEGIISYGFLKGWSIMWYLGLILTIAGAVFSIMSVAAGAFASIIVLLIQVVIILYLFKPNVKQFFLKTA